MWSNLVALNDVFERENCDHDLGGLLLHDYNYQTSKLFETAWQIKTTLYVKLRLEGAPPAHKFINNGYDHVTKMTALPY